jgi:hypothetical protein
MVRLGHLHKEPFLGHNYFELRRPQHTMSQHTKERQKLQWRKQLPWSSSSKRHTIGEGGTDQGGVTQLTTSVYR